jgi:ELWxxDGT repeat protein
MLLDSAAAVDLSLRFHGGTVRMGQNIYFSGWDPENNYELWKTDGSPEGTKMVKNINPEDASLYSIEEDRYIVFEDELYFVANDGSIGSELWKTDGTEEGTVPVTDINPLGSSSPRSLYEINGSILFIADDGTGGSELWKTDGSINGTSLLIDIYPGEEDGAFSYHSERYNGELYFAGNDGENGIELWKSDGTMEGTKMVKDISPSGSRPQDMMATDSLLYFTAADSLGRRIWQTDGTEAGTKPVLDMNGIDLMAVIDGILFFEAEDEEYGHELWRSNGTEEGTFMVKDIFEGPASSQPYFQSFVDGTLYFSAIDKDHGRELWALSQLSIGAKIQADVNEICGPETTVTISSSIENAGDNPVINWFLNDQPIEDENGSQLELSGLNDGDEVKMKVVADLSVWTDKKSIFSNTIRVRYSSLEPRITVAGNQLSTIEAAGYRWYFNGELLADETRSVTAESSGEYQVEVFNDSGCSFLSELVTVVACTNEEPVIQIDGDTISVDLSGSYTWYRDGEELPETGQSIITINPGFYRVEVTDIQGCVHTSNEVQIMLTGLENTHPGHVVNLYPNPASDFVIIESSLEEELEIHIIDLSGRKMHQGNLAPASSYELDLKTFPDGVYILIVETRKKSHLFRFIKH